MRKLHIFLDVSQVAMQVAITQRNGNSEKAVEVFTPSAAGTQTCGLLEHANYVKFERASLPNLRIPHDRKGHPRAIMVPGRDSPASIDTRNS